MCRTIGMGLWGRGLTGNGAADGNNRTLLTEIGWDPGSLAKQTAVFPLRESQSCLGLVLVFEADSML